MKNYFTLRFLLLPLLFQFFWLSSYPKEITSNPDGIVLKECLSQVQALELGFADKRQFSIFNFVTQANYFIIVAIILIVYGLFQQKLNIQLKSCVAYIYQLFYKFFFNSLAL